MKAWLLYHWTKYWAILTAPILFHASSDGYVMHAYFTISEMTDIYGTYVLVFMILGITVYYRNTLYRVFLFSTTVRTKPNGEVLKKRTELFNNVINKTKNVTLNSNSFRNLKRIINPLFKNMNNRFKK